MSFFRFQPSRLARASCLALAVAAGAAMAASPAHAGDDGNNDPAPPAPRTTLQIGDVSVVLISANNQLYAFLDRIEDNAPVSDAEMAVSLSDGSKLDMKRASNGLFVAPFDRSGHLRDAFMVSVRAPEGTGEDVAEIRYDDLKSTDSPPPPSQLGGKIYIALVSAAIGALLGTAGLRLVGARRRRQHLHPA